MASRREARSVPSDSPDEVVTGSSRTGHEGGGVGGIGAVAVGHGEHLERADDVERLDVGESDDDHGRGRPVGHRPAPQEAAGWGSGRRATAASLSRPAGGSKDESLTNSATHSPERAARPRIGSRGSPVHPKQR